MRTTEQRIFVAFTALFVSAVHSFAIPGLNLSLQCSNVVLSWPSVEGQTYIIRYRPTLNPGTPWQILTSSWPADLGTNLTVFVHSNIVQHPNCGSGGGAFASMSVGGVESDSIALAQEPAWPLAMPADGSGNAVPLALYPPGFDLSNFLIFDPASSEWTKGSAYSRQALSAQRFDGPQPQGDGSGGGGAGDPPETGFYEVVQNGVQLFGITNNETLSDSVEIQVEVGADSGTLVNISLAANGQAVPGLDDVSAPFNGPLRLNLDTTRLANGDYYLQGTAVMQTPASSGPISASLSSQGPSVTIFNEISYPAWVDYFGPGACEFNAQSATPNVDWEMDIYGYTNNQWVAIGSVFGSSTDGSIEFDWNLQDSQGHTRTESMFSGIVTTFEPAAGPAADPGSMKAQSVMPVKLVRGDNWTQAGHWVVARLDEFPSSVHNLGSFIDAANGWAQMGEIWGVLPPAGGGRNAGEALVLPTLNANSTVPQRIAAWDLMKQSITNPVTRNFYYIGEGAANALYEHKNTVYSDRALTVSEAQGLLGTGQLTNTNAHNYRFVFLDGCNTGFSSAWAKAFGIASWNTGDLGVYTRNNIRPGAFLGWTTEKKWGRYWFWQVDDTTGDLTGGTIDVGFIDYRVKLVSRWTGYYGIIPAWPLDYTVRLADDFNNDYSAGYIIYGYKNLGWDEYNDIYW